MRNLSPQQRLEAVSKAINCNPNLLNDLKGEGSLPLKIADGMIENVVGRSETAWKPPFILANFAIWEAAATTDGSSTAMGIK